MSVTLESLSVRWKINLSKEDYPIQSPNFRFQDQAWYMSCGRVSLNGGIRLYLHQFSTALPSYTPFNVFVRLEGRERGHFLRDMNQREKLDKNKMKMIWHRKFGDVFRADPMFQTDLFLTFVVTFEETAAEAGPEVHSKSFTSASVQTVYPTSCLESLVEDFSKLLEADSNPDVELRCEGHTAKAHKNVLSTRSPVLASMLHSDMVEGKTGVVNIRDMDADTFRRFLRYAYTGKLDELAVDSATSLYEAGDMYGVKSLAKRCSDFLIENLTFENFCDFLVLADAHSDAKFVEAVTAYILEERVPLSGDRWRAFCKSHSLLANGVLNRYVEVFVGPGITKNQP